ncbi:MAG: hypothetical protein L6R39_001078 [Caloplaca ligustica]|nr:MAG: hypothetical protein L6R39_001078 [Caloplaca ligustica]
MNRLQRQKGSDAAAEHVVPGDSIFALPKPRHPHQPYRPPPHPRTIYLAPIYPGGPPSSPAPSRKKRSPPRTILRSLPLPVNYPPSQTPTGKNFKHERPAPNRMKPLPPLRATFDGGGTVGKARTGALDGISRSNKPTTAGSSNTATSRTPAPAYSSGEPATKQQMSPASAPSAGGFPTLLEEWETAKPSHVKTSKPIDDEVATTDSIAGLGARGPPHDGSSSMGVSIIGGSDRIAGG